MSTAILAPLSPRRMIAPRPNCFSICRMAASTARPRSPLRWVGVWGWAGATGASMLFAGSFSRYSRRRIRSSLLAGLAAWLALLLDELDRHRLVDGRCRLNLRRLLLWLALRLVARSIGALGHLAGPPDVGRSRSVHPGRRDLIGPLAAGYRSSCRRSP